MRKLVLMVGVIGGLFLNNNKLLANEELCPVPKCEAAQLTTTSYRAPRKGKANYTWAVPVSHISGVVGLTDVRIDHRGKRGVGISVKIEGGQVVLRLTVSKDAEAGERLVKINRVAFPSIADLDSDNKRTPTDLIYALGAFVQPANYRCSRLATYETPAAVVTQQDLAKFFEEFTARRMSRQVMNCGATGVEITIPIVR